MDLNLLEGMRIRFDTLVSYFAYAAKQAATFYARKYDILKGESNETNSSLLERRKDDM